MTNVYKRPAAELGEAMGLAAHLIAVSAPPLTGWGLTLHVGKASGSLAAGMPGAAGGGRDIDAPEVASSAGVTVSVTPHALRRQITIGLLQGVPLPDMQRAARHTKADTAVGYDQPKRSFRSTPPSSSWLPPPADSRYQRHRSAPSTVSRRATSRHYLQGRPRWLTRTRRRVTALWRSGMPDVVVGRSSPRATHLASMQTIILFGAALRHTRRSIPSRLSQNSALIFKLGLDLIPFTRG